MNNNRYVLVLTSEGRSFIRGYATEKLATEAAKTEISHAYEMNGAKISSHKLNEAIKSIKAHNVYKIIPNGMEISYGELETTTERPDSLKE